jgi:hypothetical protein
MKRVMPFVARRENAPMEATFKAADVLVLANDDERFVIDVGIPAVLEPQVAGSGSRNVIAAGLTHLYVERPFGRNRTAADRV